MREQNPALFDEIDELWRRQRDYWHGLEQAHRVELEDRPDESDVQPVPPAAAAAPIVEPPAAPAEERRVAEEHDEATTEPARRDASPPPATAPAPEPAAVRVTEVERVRLAAQAVEAQLPRTQPRRKEAVVRGEGRPAGGDSLPATVREPKPPMSRE